MRSDQPTARAKTRRHNDAAADTPRDLDAMRDGDAARLERSQDMAESFCTWLHAKGAEEMQKGGEKAVETVQQLSGSFNKAARAVRLAMVAKHEVAGLRPLPNARASGAEPANQNNGASRSGPSHRLRGDWRDYGDEERAEFERTEDELNTYLATLVAALKVDLAAAPLEIQAEAARESITAQLTTIAASIPHPALDRTIADIELGRIWDVLAPRHAHKPEALGPPKAEHD